jgi:hypothetical protein
MLHRVGVTTTNIYGRMDSAPSELRTSSIDVSSIPPFSVVVARVLFSVKYANAVSDRRK